MNFLELCNFVLSEGDRVEWAIKSVEDQDLPEIARKVIRWVRQGYWDVQRWSQYFTFHLNHGRILKTENGKQIYRRAGIRKVIPNGVFARKDSWSAGQVTPVAVVEYRDWVADISRNFTAPGVPISIIRMSPGRLLVDPVPDGEYEIIGAWFREIDTLERDSDEPIWEVEDHDIVAWQALRYFMSEYEVPEALEGRIQVALSNGKREFLMKYLPTVGRGWGEL